MFGIRLIFFSVIIAAMFFCRCDNPPPNNATSIMLAASLSGTPDAPIAPPAAPHWISAEVTGPGQVTLSWTTVPGATSYNIYFAYFAGACCVATPGGISSIKIANVVSPYVHNICCTGHNSLNYVVTAVNAIGESSSAFPSYVPNPNP